MASSTSTVSLAYKTAAGVNRKPPKPHVQTDMPEVRDTCKVTLTPPAQGPGQTVAYKHHTVQSCTIAHNPDDQQLRM